MFLQEIKGIIIIIIKRQLFSFRVRRLDARLCIKAPDAVMLADAGAPAVLAFAPASVMLADARATAVLAVAPLAVMLADTVVELANDT